LYISRKLRAPFKMWSAEEGCASSKRCRDLFLSYRTDSTDSRTI